MAWIMSHKKCRCGGWHDFALDSEEMPSMSDWYSFECPKDGNRYEMQPFEAATDVESIPDGAVKLTPVRPVR